ncbi:predicted protein [Histoplasma capsulatum G186AR]|uniref:Uncharacterized protein n=1 Tax=Ajellomyces capsulatus (strain G186AR / H82 / ATCC MYA-2454 / RMSCC 2432) TaxID=447093 RepID=C0NRJ6_AJECG|nr:uncharacterized protein HCBG_05626 [Histoplasma capsulatum G186AR]EEH06310.1 predicted protein [Histoplasma capsulatum G186AR]
MTPQRSCPEVPISPHRSFWLVTLWWIQTRTKDCSHLHEPTRGPVLPNKPLTRTSRFYFGLSGRSPVEIQPRPGYHTTRGSISSKEKGLFTCFQLAHLKQRLTGRELEREQKVDRDRVLVNPSRDTKIFDFEPLNGPVFLQDSGFA